MSGILDKVDSRTQLVGQNRLELLTFSLNGSQLFAINVFKVREVVSLPKLTIMPQSHPSVVGVAYIRHQAVPVVDLSSAIGRRPIQDMENCNLIVTEYNQSIQAFLVGKVENIVILNWESIQPPPATSGRRHYLTAITQLDKQIVEIIDVEKVLAEIVPFNTTVSDDILDMSLSTQAADMTVLIVDDSQTGLAQIRETIGQLGLKIIAETDGRRALALLKNWADEGENVPEKLLMVITDAEMPEMDGYRLTAEIRSDPRLADLFVVLHTSLSGSFNKHMVEKVGCNDFLSKFQPNELAALVQKRIRQRLEELQQA
jgi:two-component system chemotaxis response regulator CheV